MEKFNEVGFLSRQLEQWTIETKSEFRAAFDTAERINRLAMKILFCLPAEDMTDAHVLANLCFGKALQAFQGALLSAQQGAVTNANTLIRSCAESAIALSALRVDASMPAKMFESHDRHRLVIANSLIERDKEEKTITAEEMAELQAVIEEIKKKYGGSKPRGINWENVARCGGAIDFYNGVYRLASADGTHTTMISLERYLTQEPKSSSPSFMFRPDKAGLPSALFNMCSVMLQALGAVADWFDLSPHHDELAACIEDWKKSDYLNSSK